MSHTHDQCLSFNEIPIQFLNHFTRTISLWIQRRKAFVWMWIIPLWTGEDNICSDPVTGTDCRESAGPVAHLCLFLLWRLPIQYEIRVPTPFINDASPRNCISHFTQFLYQISSQSPTMRRRRWLQWVPTASTRTRHISAGARILSGDACFCRCRCGSYSEWTYLGVRPAPPPNFLKHR